MSIRFLMSGLLFFSTAASAEQFFSKPGTDSIQRLQDAYERVRSEPSVSTALRNDQVHSLSAVQREANSGVETTKFQHYYKGVEVVGSMVFHHEGRAGASIRDQMARFDLDTTPSLSSESAVSLARSIVGDRELKSAPELKILPSDDQGSAELVWFVELKGENFLEGGREVILNASSGAVIANISDAIPLAPIDVYSAKGLGVKVDLSQVKGKGNPAWAKACQVIDSNSGDPVALNPRACDRVISADSASGAADSSARNALRNSEEVLTYYRNVHNRNSYDNNGALVVNVVHVGNVYDNAFWYQDGNFMSYGDGDGKEFGDFTGALDVAGHELTHGITAHTSKLLRMKDAGALNEAYSDFFGIQIAHPDNWVVGKGIMLGHGEGIRNLENPTALAIHVKGPNGKALSIPYPANVSKRLTAKNTCDQTNDNCFVHFNATIAGHASYLVAQALGNDKARELYYVTLTQYLKSNSGFLDAAQATVEACKQIKDFGDSDCQKVAEAFAQVGLKVVGASSSSPATGAPGHHGLNL